MYHVENLIKKIFADHIRSEEYQKDYYKKTDALQSARSALVKSEQDSIVLLSAYCEAEQEGFVQGFKRALALAGSPLAVME